MNDWFYRNLGDAMMAFEPLDHIETMFGSAYRTIALPKDVAVFVRHVSEGGLHCQVEVYFSPASGSLARKAGASPCERPSTDGLDLLIGSDESWSALFPEARS